MNTDYVTHQGFLLIMEWGGETLMEKQNKTNQNGEEILKYINK